MGQPYNQDVKPGAEMLLKENGIIRGDAKGQIVASESNYIPQAVADTRNYSSDNYTAYPSQEIKFKRPDVKPSVTPDKAQQ